MKSLDEFLGLNDGTDDYFVGGFMEDMDSNTRKVLREIERDLEYKKLELELIDILPNKNRQKDEILREYGEERILEHSAKAFSEDKFFCLESAVEKVEKLSKAAASKETKKEKREKRKEGMSM